MFQIMAFKNAKNENVSMVLSSEAKSRLKWTPELHQRFIDAINQLGGADRATPKSIMRIMGIHGLTLYHLKSHLQKYRLGKSQNSMSRGRKEQDYKENERCQAIEENREGDQRKPDRTLEISQAFQNQMEVQRNLCQQVEVQKHLQLRIEAQGKYLQSVLQRAQEETLAIYNSKTVSMNCPGSSLSLLTELQGSLPKNAKTMQSGRDGCSLESSLTSSDNNSKRNDNDDQENRTSTPLSSVEMDSTSENGSNVNIIGRKRGIDAIMDENNGAQQSRNSQESKTFMFLESLDLNSNV
ncbi:DNA-binding transcription factor [Lithospermum erythrorhizon]|uniref:DNA-binding transcription factor n=1 Tax=Lithospermum erythrorhizon TaxID=34254 RepID=A0AAV3PK97_LITER